MLSMSRNIFPQTRKKTFKDQSEARAFQELIWWLEQHPSNIHVIGVTSRREDDYRIVQLSYRRKAIN